MATPRKPSRPSSRNTRRRQPEKPKTARERKSAAKVAREEAFAKIRAEADAKANEHRLKAPTSFIGGGGNDGGGSSGFGRGRQPPRGNPNSIRYKQKEAAKWFIRTIAGVAGNFSDSFLDKIEAKDINPTGIFVGKSAATRFVPGQIYFWIYDPKWKHTLPFYDTCPLVVLLKVFARTDDEGRRSVRFLGLNTHYLPYGIRIKFIESLLDTLGSDLSDDAKAQINYQKVKEMSEWSVAKPCVKEYIFSHVRSAIVKIPPRDWEHVAVLPIERFEKASKQAVWRKSREMTR